MQWTENWVIVALRIAFEYHRFCIRFLKKKTLWRTDGEGGARSTLCLFWDDCPIFAGGTNLDVERFDRGWEKEVQVAYSGHKGRAEHTSSTTPIYAFTWGL
jgi:hypothetical protein